MENASPKKAGMISGFNDADPVQAHEDDVERHDRDLRGEHERRQDQDRATPRPRQRMRERA